MVTASALTLLRAYLGKELAHGRKYVELNEAGRTAAHNLVRHPPAKRATPSSAKSTSPPVPPAQTAPPVLQESTALPQTLANHGKGILAQVLQVAGDSLAEKLQALAQLAEKDPQPRALGSLRETMVFAVGDPRSRIMFVGEAPGAEEEHQREPFVGPAGQLLTKIISVMGLSRSSVYITNICKFRPAMDGFQGMKNRAPTVAEMNVCVKYVLTEISLIRPRCIVALGATAATGLGIEGKVGALRGRFHALEDIPVMVTYHPSYLLRQETAGPEAARSAKLLVWQDLLMVMEKLGMEISTKQRNYFLPKD